MNSFSARSLLVLLALLLAIPMTLSGCDRDDEDPSFARAERISHRSQLIGGATALGEVGDYLLENDQIRLVIQDLTFNRGSGIFGGSLIDADLVRFDGSGSSFGGNGRDTFGELFPAYFLEVIDPDEIVIVNDGSNGEAAVLEVRGRGGEFVTMLRFFNQAMVNSYEASFGDLAQEIPNSDGEPLVTFTARYILEPGARHVRLEAEMVNESMTSLTFPNRNILQALDAFLPDVDLSTFTVPTGTVLGFGALNKLFVPGIGYDIRFGMEDLYQQPVELPAIPGLLTDLVATSGTRGISYGFATSYDEDSNFVFNKPDFYENPQPDSMLFLFYASGFAGVFANEVPSRLAPSYCQPDRSAEEVCSQMDGNRQNTCFENYDSCLELNAEIPDSFTSSHYFILGSGDVASVREELYRIRGQETFTVSGQVLNDFDSTPVREHTPLFIYQALDGAESPEEACTPTDTQTPYLFNQAQTNREGYVNFQLPSGQYCYRVRDQADTSDFVFFEVDERPLNLRIFAPSGGRVEGFVVDQDGTPIPAKFTVVGEYQPRPDLHPRNFLFDLSVGEHWRPGEFVSYDDGDNSPRRVIESIAFSGADGKSSFYLRPGTYTVYVSRGAEYDLFTQEIEVTRGNIARVSAQLKRQVLAEGYLSADLHLHAQGSIDSGLNYNDRVISVAAEGVEIAVASDHNYISDYMPYIYRNNLQPWLRSIVGLELTSFEGGHFNAFPLRQDISDMNRGSIKWQDVPPQKIFDDLRAMGSSTAVPVIQVNHPRDSLLGYFNQHYVDPLTGVAELPFNTAEGIDLILASAASPNGSAFVEPYEASNGRTQYRSTFSYDFDAIEIYNGKRINLLEHFRMPFDKADMPEDIRAQLTDEQYDALPDQAGVILCDGDDVAYPGGLDDWFNFLNYPRPDGTYRRYTATGNSDSHSAGAIDDPEPGFPKNYVYVGHDDPQQLKPEELVDGIKNHRVIVTNGPYIDMSIDGQPLGSTVISASKQVTLDLVAHAADWVGVDEFILRANGEIVYEGQIELVDGQWADSVTLEIDGDTWFIMEARGNNNLFPIVQPAEIPPIDFEQVIGSLAGAFGFGGGVEGLEPTEITEIRPLAFTNPIWVIDDSEGEGRTEFVPPSPPLAGCIDGSFQSMQMRSGEDWIPFGHRRLDAQSVPLDLHRHSPVERRQGELRDARVIFEHWGGHSH